MSEIWIEGTIREMQESKDLAVQETARILKSNEAKWVLRANVLDSRGFNRWQEPTRLVEKLHETSVQSKARPMEVTIRK